MTAHYGYMMIDLASEDGTDCAYKKFIGSGVNDGAWHYVEVDLGSFVASQEAGDSLLAINGLEFNCYAYDLYIDDIILSGGELERSYGLVPGELLSYFGVQTGSSGATEIPSWGKYYYHFTDLGSLGVTTNDMGNRIGDYERGFFGYYLFTNGTAPDSMGITSKLRDTEADMYYFNLRWYDAERCRFVSRDPLGYYDGPNLYTFTLNDPVNYSDPTGLSVSHFAICMTACYLGFGSISELMNLWTGLTNPKLLSRDARRSMELAIRKEMTGSHGRPISLDMDKFIKDRAEKMLKTQCKKKMGAKLVKVFGPNAIPGLGQFVSAVMTGAEVWKVASCTYQCTAGTFPE